MITRKPVRSVTSLMSALLAVGLLSSPVLAGLERPLILEVTPSAEQPKVGDPIHFKVRSNRDAQLYLYVTDPSTGMSTMLLPNRRQTDNRLPAEATLMVPGSDIRYAAEKAGVLRITAVASTRPLDIVGTLEPTGDLATLPAKDIESSFITKGMTPDSSHVHIGRDELVVSRFELHVLADEPPPATPPPASAEPAPAGIAFVSSNAQRLRVGDALRVVFGADRPGWVHLFVVEPDGRRSQLSSKESDGKTIETIETIAEAPTGDHTLVVLYTPGPQVDPGLLDQQLSRYRDKGLRLMEDLPPGAIAVQHLDILP